MCWAKTLLLQSRLSLLPLSPLLWRHAWILRSIRSQSRQNYSSFQFYLALSRACHLDWILQVYSIMGLNWRFKTILLNFAQNCLFPHHDRCPCRPLVLIVCDTNVSSGENSDDLPHYDLWNRFAYQFKVHAGSIFIWFIVQKFKGFTILYMHRNTRTEHTCSLAEWMICWLCVHKSVWCS